MEQKPSTITDIIKPELPTIEALLLMNNNESVQTMALQELSYLEQHIALKPDLMKCTPASIILAVRNVMRKNLSLDPSAGLVYIKSRNQNIAPYGKPDHWIQVLEIQETANGKLSYNRQLGRILDFENPKVTKDATGRVIGVSMQLLKPSPLGPRWELYEYDESDFRRWQTYSHKENSKRPKDNKKPDPETLNYSNALYTSWNKGIDPEFARAKCINHSLKKLGANPNESNKIIRIEKSAPVIDPGIATAEAEDDNFTPHEEVNSSINQSDTGHEPTQMESFNASDL